ncbi:MAG: S-layer homology domain-containing protein, partial [Candidatus Peregrinibacteria bacterium]
PPDLAKQTNDLVTQQSQDRDYDGCPDSWGGKKDMTYSSVAGAIAAEVGSVASLLRCSGGGCLPIPYNYAFLAPDQAVPGIATFAAGTSFPPFFAFFLPSSLLSTFRVYVMPTLTMGVGTAICTGPSQPPISPCFAYAIPMSAIGACPNFLGPVNDAIAAAKNSLSDPDVGMSTVVSDGSASAGTDAISGNFAYSDPDSPVSAAGSVNIRVPGFPSVITNWIDKQTDEIYNKLLDLPDFYFIYPDAKTLISDYAVAGANFGKIKNIHDFLRAINSLPLIQIEGKEVMMKVPAISETELIKWKRQAEAWIKYEEDQIARLKEYWSCDENEDRKTLCDKVTVDMRALISSVKTLMDKLDMIANLPREILDWRNLESKYASQIVCYLDAIMQFTGGYIQKQQKTVEAWMKAVEDVIRTFKDWKLILDLVADYQASCDQCKNDRFSKLGLLLQVFAAIPDPPIIPLPKWPDIVFDISQIQTGIKIVWPDLVFKPEPIILPNLPYITMPEIPIPDLIITLPGFEIPDWILEFPSFVMPDLPDLPPLPIPDLPDLPRPPKIPKLPNLISKLIASLKPIFKILCLLKNGLIPVPEGFLETEVETLTQPTVQAVLPIIKQLGMQMPAIQYDYVEQIRIDAKINMGIDTGFVYTLVRKGAEIMNENVEKLIENINKYTGLPWQYAIDNAIKMAMEKVQNAAQTVIEGTQETVEGAQETIDQSVGETSFIDEFIDETDMTGFFGIENNINDAVDAINEYIENMDADVSPDSYYLSATQKYLASDDPVLNRDISDVEAAIASRDVENYDDSPEMKRLAALRDTLIDYASGLDESNTVLSQIDDYNSFIKVLAESDQSLENLDRLASLDVDAADMDSGTQDSNEVKTDFFGEGEKEVLLAAKVDIDPAKAVSGGEEPAEAPEGFYIVVDGQNESILNYTPELKKTVNTLFSDVDGDGDTDIIYSMGGDLYLKENYKKSGPQYPKGEVVLSATSSSVSDFAVSQSGQGGITETSYESDSSQQACADKESPFPVAAKTDYEVTLFKELEIDASASFDTGGKIRDYFLEIPSSQNILWSDLNSAIDENGDGIVWNDKSNPIFKIGPYTDKDDLGVHKFILNVVDQSNNVSKLELNVNVVVPNISLDDVFGRVSTASGDTSPGVDSIPFSLMRSRYILRVQDGSLKLVPRIDKIITDSAGSNGKYLTDSDGSYEISDLDTEDMILVENKNGDIVAEINPKTGNIGKFADGYGARVNPAFPPETPTSIDVIDSGGRVLGTVYNVGDPNVDVRINKQITTSGVYVNDTAGGDSFELVSFPADNPTQSGSAALISADDHKILAVIDTSGNIMLMDDRMTLKKKDNDHNADPLIIELLFEGRSEAEVRIYFDLSAVEITGPEGALFSTPREAPVSSFSSQSNIIGKTLFTDADAGLNRIVADLYAKDIIDGTETPEGLKLNPDQKITRAEFVKILLNMLCIIPRPEAYLPYSTDEANGGYTDVIFSGENMLWYYPYIKEADLLGLIYGYRGETDPITGLHPFKPDSPISRAEVTQIILETLEYKGIIDLSSLSIGDPWYAPFMTAAEDLTDYVFSGQIVKNNFIVTPEEALMPDEEMIRKQIIITVTRVLDFYNCFEIDNDNDGMSDFCEEKYGISNPYDDADGDGVLNVNECYYNLDPTNADTDSGGVSDSEELAVGTDPLDPSDDSVGAGGEGENATGTGSEVNENVDYKEGSSGLYIVPADCNTCPCVSTFLHKADIIPGDVFFTIISTFDDSYIFSKSNEVTIQTVTTKP